MQVAGLVHDLGKLLYFFGSECVSSLCLTIRSRGARLTVFLGCRGQWDVVGVSHVMADVLVMTAAD